MSRIAAIGEQRLLEGYALAGVELHAAEDAASVRAAWSALPGEVALVLLTPAAREALAGESPDRSAADRLWAVVPG